MLNSQGTRFRSHSMISTMIPFDGIQMNKKIPDEFKMKEKLIMDTGYAKMRQHAVAIKKKFEEIDGLEDLLEVLTEVQTNFTSKKIQTLTDEEREEFFDTVNYQFLREEVKTGNQRFEKLYQSFLPLSRLQSKNIQKCANAKFSIKDDDSESENQSISQMCQNIEEKAKAIENFDFGQQKVEDHIGCAVVNRVGDVLLLNARGKELLGLQKTKIIENCNFFSLMPLVCRKRLKMRFGRSLYEHMRENKSITSRVVIYNKNKIKKTKLKEKLLRNQMDFKNRFPELMRTGTDALSVNFQFHSISAPVSISEMELKFPNFTFCSIDKLQKEISTQSKMSLSDFATCENNTRSTLRQGFMESCQESEVNIDLCFILFRKSTKQNIPSYIISADFQQHSTEFIRCFDK